MVISVMGLGFVGLTSALGFCSLGNKVYGFDKNPERLNTLKNNKIDFKEPYLPKIHAKYLNKKFFLDATLETAVKESELIFLCVGSPCQESGEVDLSQITDAVKEIISVLPDDGKHRSIVIKSTVPPLTCKNSVEPLVRASGISEERLSVASNPEFLREGYCWEDFTNPGKIIIGVKDEEAKKQLLALYKPMKNAIHVFSTNGAEFSKYLSNVMLSTLISMSNEFAAAADTFGDINIPAVFDALHDDSRLRNSGIASYIYPGCGFGGYCLPKDTKAFYAAMKNAGHDSKLIEEVLNINEEAAKRLSDKVTKNTNPADSIGVLGLSFKPGSDDVRETPSAKLISSLIAKGYKSIIAYDPIAIESFKKLYPSLDITYVTSAKEVFEKCSNIVIATAWTEFKTLDYTGKTVYDGRYILK